ncbi:MAG TPA: deoxyribonuclease IV [Firmicutes bacterium]|nr:deoxyribonuclease IV [Bacillota bacterium]
MRIGVHVSIAGGVDKAVTRAADLGCDTMQVFSRSPRTLRSRPLDEGEVARFRGNVERTGICPVVIHIPYLLNLASPQENTYSASVEALCEDMGRAGALGAQFLVIHPGSHLGQGVAEGIRRISRAIERALSSPGHPMLLLETVSGAGTEIGARFEELRDMMAGVTDASRVGVCIDTCHLWASGYDVRTPEGLEETLSHLDTVIGFDKVKVVHLNDSVYGRGSRKDRHAHIGEGTIGDEGFRVILGHPRLRNLSFILETPNPTPEDDFRNLRHARALAGA